MQSDLSTDLVLGEVLVVNSGHHFAGHPLQAIQADCQDQYRTQKRKKNVEGKEPQADEGNNQSKKTDTD